MFRSNSKTRSRSNSIDIQIIYKPNGDIQAIGDAKIVLIKEGTRFILFYYHKNSKKPKAGMRSLKKLLQNALDSGALNMSTQILIRNYIPFDNRTTEELVTYYERIGFKQISSEQPGQFDLSATVHDLITTIRSR